MGPEIAQFHGVFEVKKLENQVKHSEIINGGRWYCRRVFV